jgi:hypothetical protein
VNLQKFKYIVTDQANLLRRESGDRLLNSRWITYSKSSKKRHHERRRRWRNNEVVSDDKLVTALHKDPSTSASPGWRRSKVTIILWHVADVLHDLAALAMESGTELNAQSA